MDSDSKGLLDAIERVTPFASDDSSKFRLTCIHLHPDYVEACDNMQAMRYRIKTGFKDSMLVRATSMTGARPLDLREMAVTKEWVHFRNKQIGLRFSCRRYDDKYVELDKEFKFQGHHLILPAGLKEACARAEIFAAGRSDDSHGPSSPLITVKISNNRLTVLGEGISGKYEEQMDVAYKGAPLVFMLAPEILKHLAEQCPEVLIGKDKIKVVTANWEYVTFVALPVEEEDGNGNQNEGSPQ